MEFGTITQIENPFNNNRSSLAYNILKNAIEYSYEGNKVIIDCEDNKLIINTTIEYGKIDMKKYKEIEGENALCDVILHTGRTHQIRVQFSSRKTPLTGDVKYGSKDKTTGDIALHSYRITFYHPVTNEKLVFSAEPDFDVYPWNVFGGLENA